MNWITKTIKKVAGHGSDISITMTEGNLGKQRITFILRNNCYAKLTKNEHVVIAISGTRVYFKEASPAEGFKLTCFNKSRSNCNFRVSTDIVPLSEKGVELGDYRLMFDPMVKLYYIDIAKKIKYE